jgi:hypothetical protein
MSTKYWEGSNPSKLENTQSLVSTKLSKQVDKEVSKIKNWVLASITSLWLLVGTVWCNEKNSDIEQLHDSIEKFEKKEDGSQLVLNSDGAYERPNLEELLNKYSDSWKETITISEKDNTSKQIPIFETKEWVKTSETTKKDLQTPIIWVSLSSTLNITTTKDFHQIIQNDLKIPKYFEKRKQITDTDEIIKYLQKIEDLRKAQALVQWEKITDVTWVKRTDRLADTEINNRGAIKVIGNIKILK